MMSSTQDRRAGRLAASLLLVIVAAALAPSRATAQCVPNPVVANGTIVTCSGTVVPPYSVPGLFTGTHIILDNTVTMNAFGDGISSGPRSFIDNSGDITVSGTGAFGLRSGSGDATTSSIITNETGGVIRVTGGPSIGIQMGDFAITRNEGEIDVSSDDSFGAALGNDSTIENSGTLIVSGDGATGAAVGERGFIFNSGDVTVSGDGAVGLLVGNGDATTVAIVENQVGSVIQVSGAGSTAISMGNFGIARNRGLIEVSGDGSTAIQVGSNVASSVENYGTIRLSADNTRGMVSGNGTDQTNMAGASIVLEVGATNSIAMESGLSGPAENAGTIQILSDDSIGILGGAADTALNSGTITIDGARGRGLSSGASALTLLNGFDGVITLNGAESYGLELTGIVTGTATSFGEITANGDDSFGISVSDNQTANNNGDLTMNGANSTGVFVGTAGNGFNRGTLTLGGDGGVALDGVGGGDDSSRTDLTNETDAIITSDRANVVGIRSGNFARIVNRGEITLSGSDAVGIEAGNSPVVVNFGNLMLSGPNALAIDIGASGALGQNGNDATIEVTGDNSRVANVGANTDFNNFGTITVGGMDSTGLVFAGYSSGTQDDAFFTFQNDTVDDSITGEVIRAGQLVSIDPLAGPLITLNDSTNGENRVRNGPTGSITADTSQIALAGRGIAIQGSNTVDIVANAGDIEGHVLLAGGDDVLRVRTSGTFTGPGDVDGGGGSDIIELLSGTELRGTLALDRPLGFEAVEIKESSAWSLTGAAQTPLTLQIDHGGRLVLESPISNISSYDHEPITDPTTETQATVVANVGAPLAAPLLHVTGNASLDDGILIVAAGSGSGALNGEQTYVIVQADGGIAGAEQFDDILFDTTGGVSFGTPVYDANSLTISMFLPNHTPNQGAVEAYKQMVQASSLTGEIQQILTDLDTLPLDQYRAALDQLHPEPYDAQVSSALAMADEYVQMMLDRPHYCVAESNARERDPRTNMPCRTGLTEPWFNVYGQWRNRTGSPGHTSYNDSGTGIVFGLDSRLSNSVVITGTVGATHSSLQVDEIGSGRASTIDVGLYGEFTHGPVRTQGVFSYSHGWHTTYRNLMLPNFARTAKGDFNSNRIGVRGAIEYGFDMAAWRLAPNFSVDYTRFMQGAIDETGADPMSLVIDAANYDIVALRPGIELTAELRKNDYWTDLTEWIDGTWRPVLAVRWRQVVEGSERGLTSRWSGAPASTAGTFGVFGDDADMGFEIGTGIDFTPRGANRLTFGVHYDAFVWENVATHNLSGRVRLAF